MFDPFHIGALWRDWSFARAACRDVRRSQPSLVESHEHLLCCDVYRAGDGVHAVWLEERSKHASPARRLGAMLSPYNRYRLHVERRLYASPWLRAVICNSQMVRDEIRDRFAVPEAKLHVIPQPGRQRALPSGSALGARRRRRASGHRCRRDGVSARRRGLCARRARDRHRCVRGARPARAPDRDRRRQGGGALPRAGARSRRRRSRDVRRRGGRPAALLRRRRRVRAAGALRSVAGHHARSHGVRLAGDHEHEIGSGRAAAQERRRARRSLRRRGGARRADAGVARSGHAGASGGQRAARRAATCRRPRSRCSRCSSTAICSPHQDPPTLHAGVAAPRTPPENDDERNRFRGRRQRGDLRVPRRRDRGRDEEPRRRRRTPPEASGRGSTRTTATTACCGTKRTARAGAMSRTPRSPRTSARSTATTSDATTRSRRSTRRCSSGWPPSCPRPTPGTTRRPRARWSIGCRSSPSSIPHAHRGDARRRDGRPPRVVPATSSSALRLQRADLARCLDTLLARAAEGRAYWRVYRQFKMYNDAALNPYLYGGKR